MLQTLIKALTGRSYAVTAGDIGYLWSKGGVPFLRGCLWSLVRLRNPRGLLLGPHIQFVQSSRLRNARGAAIGAFSYIDCSAEDGIVLGARATIRERAWIQGRSGLNDRAAGLVVGARSYIGPNAVIGLGGPVIIGEDVQIGAGLSITAESHVADTGGDFTSGHVARRGIRIGDRCWFGNNVTVLDGVEIGEGCVIGAGSVVTRSIPPRSVAFGAPARVHRSIGPA